MQLPYQGKTPKIHSSVFIARGAVIIGDASIGKDSNIWYNTVIRADVAPVNIGELSNIQDGSVIHTSRFNGPCNIGDRVTVGHMCLLHATTLHNDSFVGMGSVVMDKTIIEPFGFLAAGSLLTPGKIIKSNELWAGRPAKYVRNISDEELFLIKDTPTHYLNLATNHQYKP